MTAGDNNMDKLLSGGLSKVNKLKQDKVPPYRKPLEPIPRQRLLDNHRVMEELLEASDETTSFESGDELKFLRTGLSNYIDCLDFQDFPDFLYFQVFLIFQFFQMFLFFQIFQIFQFSRFSRFS